MAKKKWIKSSIKRPGRMHRLAQREGISVHEAEERASQSSNKSLAAAGRLGLELTAKSKKSRGERWYGGK